MVVVDKSFESQMQGMCMGTRVKSFEWANQLILPPFVQL